MSSQTLLYSIVVESISINLFQFFDKNKNVNHLKFFTNFRLYVCNSIFRNILGTIKVIKLYNLY